MFLLYGPFAVWSTVFMENPKGFLGYFCGFFATVLTVLGFLGLNSTLV
jgi:hypothetical protein